MTEPGITGPGETGPGVTGSAATGSAAAGSATVAVRLPTVLRPFAGGAERVEVEVDGPPTVSSVFAALEGPHPALRRRLTDEQGAVRRHVNIYLGNDNIRDLSGLQTQLADGDELLVLPSVAGG